LIAFVRADRSLGAHDDRGVDHLAVERKRAATRLAGAM
jgi:hypothetical protein